MDKKSKKKRVRILYLLLLILLSGIMLTTSTYAWFTVNRIVYVDTLNVKIEAQGGIEISVDGSDWKSMINSDDLNSVSATYPSSVNQLPLKMEPVSTGGEVENGRLKMFYGIATSNSSGEYVLSSVRDVESANNEDGKFIAMDIFLKVDNGGKLYLTSDSGATYNGDRTPGIENAIRFAFLVEGTVPTGTNVGTIQALNGALESDVYIWEVNYDVHSDTAIRNAEDVYGIRVGNSGNNRIVYDGVRSDIDIQDNVKLGEATASNYPNYFKTVDVDYATVSGFSNNQEIFELSSGITKIRVYIWLEGQDVDCENYSAVGNIDFKFQFSTNP